QQAEFFTNKDRLVLKSNKVLDIPEENINTERGTLILHTKKIAIRDEQGRSKYLLGISEDITKSKQALKELERQREIVTNLTDNLPGMIYQCRNDENWTLDFANVGVKDITGYDRGVLLKGEIHYGEIIHPEDQNFVWEAVQVALDKKEPFTIRYRIVNADKQVRWVWERGAGFYDRKGNLEFLHGFISDITEQKAIEEQLERHSDELEELVKERTQQLKDAQGELIKNERLAVLGQLTATVSHELRNPLGAIRMSVHLVDKEINRNNTKLLNSIERIKRNIAHCDTIIDELLDFTNTRQLNKEAIELDTFIAEQISEFEWNKDISVSKNLNCDGMELLVDRNRLRRILINAFQNAQQAILSEKLSKLKQAKITITTASNNQEVELKIQDNGPGIPDKFQSKIFEPLFSTKSFGVGLGMNVIQQVMQQHAGGVEVKSKEGEGTEIRLWFPLVD
ncbi:MAG: ATP-binding protein, partial [Thioalkalispiraceae bacterium]